MEKSEKAKEDHLIFRNYIETLQSKDNIEGTLLDNNIKLLKHAKHLTYLLKAISKVNYWKYVAPLEYEEDVDEAISKPFTERAFAYELYHQWRNILEEEQEKELILNGELSKKVSIFKGLSEIIKQEEDNNKDHIFPDLILHEGFNPEQQVFVCEIKKEVPLNDSKVFYDLYKLCFLTNCDNYKFEYGIFIVVGKKLPETTDRSFSESFSENFLNKEESFSKFFPQKSDASSRKDFLKNVSEYIICISYYLPKVGQPKIEIRTLDQFLIQENKSHHP
ncbi:hypothetical protein KZY59_11740 [Prevotella buccae]|uniref:hypothetical protein n=1 Tax=Segatella buccae TaxID=28126 RepID=UPI001C5F961A|nr:hypothetical protein [Segatella buccae]MBW4872190.1 hypothetical protein [Segatella buccae]